MGLDVVHAELRHYRTQPQFGCLAFIHGLARFAARHIEILGK